MRPCQPYISKIDRPNTSSTPDVGDFGQGKESSFQECGDEGMIYTMLFTPAVWLLRLQANTIDPRKLGASQGLLDCGRIQEQ